jgi:hypothetical protein
MQKPLKLPTRPARVRAQSKALWNEARSPDRADFYTVGYEGKTTEQLLNDFRKCGVRSVLDIRLLDQPEKYERELEDMAMAAVRALRRTIYDHHSQWI